MTTDQILKALDRYENLFVHKPSVRPIRFPADRHNPTHAETMGHLYWMTLDAKTFAAEKPEKAQRWLCFIQGALWRDGGHTIDEFKDDNRSEA